MPKRHLRTEQAEALNIVDRGPPAATARVFLLIAYLDEMHVERDAMLLRALRQHGQRLVRTPMQVRRGQLNLHALLVVMLGVEMLEQCDRILARQLKAVKMLCEHWTHVGGDTVEELLVRLVDEMVLIAQRKAIGDAHADVFVCADDRFRAFLNLRELARHPAVNVLYGGDARG